MLLSQCFELGLGISDAFFHIGSKLGDVSLLCFFFKLDPPFLCF